MDQPDLPETRLVPKAGLVGSVEARAAAVVADAGGTPRQQIDAARKARKLAGKRGSVLYTSHQGKKQRERALRRMAQQVKKAQHDG